MIFGIIGTVVHTNGIKIGIFGTNFYLWLPPRDKWNCTTDVIINIVFEQCIEFVGFYSFLLVYKDMAHVFRKGVKKYTKLK